MANLCRELDPLADGGGVGAVANGPIRMKQRNHNIEEKIVLYYTGILRDGNFVADHGSAPHSIQLRGGMDRWWWWCWTTNSTFYSDWPKQQMSLPNVVDWRWWWCWWVHVISEIQLLAPRRKGPLLRHVQFLIWRFMVIMLES